MFTKNHILPFKRILFLSLTSVFAFFSIKVNAGCGPWQTNHVACYCECGENGECPYGGVIPYNWICSGNCDCPNEDCQQTGTIYNYYCYEAHVNCHHGESCDPLLNCSDHECLPDVTYYYKWGDFPSCA